MKGEINLKSFVMIMICLGISMAVYAQDMPKLNVRLKNKPLKVLFETIEKQTDYTFMYSNVDINQLVSINANQKPLDQVLKEVLQGKPLTYDIRKKQILIIPLERGEKKKAIKKIFGQITDNKQDAIIGASIKIKGVNTGTVTDLEGKFALEIKSGQTMIISYVGYEPQEVVVGDKDQYQVVLNEDLKALDEVVVVGYGTQRKGNLTGAIAVVKSEDLIIAPVANVTNMLGGHTPGLITKQESGLPGSDGAKLSIRGFDNPLVVVDGVESSFANIDASQIESISVLKDGAASIYGARAGNGVILVTTKRGVEQKPIIQLNTSFTMQGITKMVKPASSGQRKLMEREEWIQAGKPISGAPWTEEEIEKHMAGNDPSYPNTNWFDEVFRPWAPQQNHNISLRGGSEKVKYYGFFGYTNQETMIKEAGGDYERYNVQSNVDAQITKNLSLSVDLSLAFEKRDFPVRGMGNGGSTWQDLYSSKPWYPATLPDPSKIAWGGIDVGSIAVTTNKDLSGYRKENGNDIRTTASLAYDFSDWVKGLKAKAFVNYINNSSYTKRFVRPVTFYTYNKSTETYTEAGFYNKKAELNEYFNQGSILTQQYSLTYDHLFNRKHKLSALALLEMINYNNNNFNAGRKNFLTATIDQMYAGSTEGMTTGGSASEMGRASAVGRINYGYMDKYLIETIFRADASAKFPSNKQWGFFPSVSLGWVMSQESFLNHIYEIDNIKVRASAGRSGNDAIGNFQYLAGYEVFGSYILGDEAMTQIHATGLPNPNLTWETMTIYNAGLDFSFFKRNIYGTIDAFYRLREGIPGTRSASLPSSFGASLPLENLNSISTRGFELSLGTSNKINDFSYDITGNISWSRSKWDYFDEPDYVDPDQMRLTKKTGQWTDISYGYVSDKLFTSQKEINNLPYVYTSLGGNHVLRPGDIKFLDTNNDTVLDWKDQQIIGQGNSPHWMYGFNIALRYKDFDLTGLLQGAFGYNTWVNLTHPITEATFNLRWIEESNNPNALVPRLGGSGSNSWQSDFFNQESSYLRLKNASIGYNLPKTILSKVKISGLRVYVAGTNLFTISNLNKYGIDPEAPQSIMYYPQQRTISIGANLSF